MSSKTHGMHDADCAKANDHSKPCNCVLASNYTSPSVPQSGMNKRVVHVTVKFRAEINDAGLGTPAFQVDAIVDAAVRAIPTAVAWLPGATVAVALDRKSATAARATSRARSLVPAAAPKRKS